MPRILRGDFEQRLQQPRTRVDLALMRAALRESLAVRRIFRPCNVSERWTPSLTNAALLMAAARADGGTASEAAAASAPLYITNFLQEAFTKSAAQPAVPLRTDKRYAAYTLTLLRGVHFGRGEDDSSDDAGEDVLYWRQLRPTVAPLVQIFLQAAALLGQRAQGSAPSAPTAAAASSAARRRAPAAARRVEPIVPPIAVGRLSTVPKIKEALKTATEELRIECSAAGVEAATGLPACDDAASCAASARFFVETLFGPPEASSGGGGGDAMDVDADVGSGDTFTVAGYRLWLVVPSEDADAASEALQFAADAQQQGASVDGAANVESASSLMNATFGVLGGTVVPYPEPPDTPHGEAPLSGSAPENEEEEEASVLGSEDYDGIDIAEMGPGGGGAAPAAEPGTPMHYLRRAMASAIRRARVVGAVQATLAVNAATAAEVAARNRKRDDRRQPAVRALLPIPEGVPLPDDPGLHYTAVHCDDALVRRGLLTYFQPGKCALFDARDSTAQRRQRGWQWVEPRPFLRQIVDWADGIESVAPGTLLGQRADGTPLSPDRLFWAPHALAAFASTRAIDAAQCDPASYFPGDGRRGRDPVEGHEHDDLQHVARACRRWRHDTLLAAPAWPRPEHTFEVGSESLQPELFAALPLPYALGRHSRSESTLCRAPIAPECVNAAVLFETFVAAWLLGVVERGGPMAAIVPEDLQSVLELPASTSQARRNVTVFRMNLLAEWAFMNLSMGIMGANTLFPAENKCVSEALRDFLEAQTSRSGRQLPARIAWLASAQRIMPDVSDDPTNARSGPADWLAHYYLRPVSDGASAGDGGGDDDGDDDSGHRRLRALDRVACYGRDVMRLRLSGGAPYLDDHEQRNIVDLQQQYQTDTAAALQGIAEGALRVHSEAAADGGDHGRPSRSWLDNLPEEAQRAALMDHVEELKRKSTNERMRRICERMENILKPFVDADAMLGMRQTNASKWVFLEVEEETQAKAIEDCFAGEAFADIRARLHASVQEDFRDKRWQERLRMGRSALVEAFTSDNVAAGLRGTRHWLEKHCKPRKCEHDTTDMMFGWNTRTVGRPSAHIAQTFIDAVVFAFSVGAQTFPYVVIVIYVGKSRFHFVPGRTDPACNVIILGEAGVGKSFIIIVLEQTLVPGSANTATHVTQNAHNVQDNQDGVVHTDSEFKTSMLSSKIGATDVAARTVMTQFKNRLTLHYTRTTQPVIDEKTKKREIRESYCSHQSVNVIACDQPIKEIDPGVGRRFLPASVARLTAKDNLTQAADMNMQFEVLGTSRSKARIVHALHTLDAQVLLLESLIRTGALPDVLMDGAKYMVVAVRNDLKKQIRGGNLMFSNEIVCHLLELIRAIVLTEAAYMAQFSPLARAYYDSRYRRAPQHGADAMDADAHDDGEEAAPKPRDADRWSAEAMLALAGPFLYAKSDHVVQAVSILAPLIVKEQEERTLVTSMTKGVHIKEPARWQFARKTQAATDGGAGSSSASAAPYDPNYICIDVTASNEDALFKIIGGYNTDYEIRHSEVERMLIALKNDVIPRREFAFAPGSDPMLHASADEFAATWGRKPRVVRLPETSPQAAVLFIQGQSGTRRGGHSSTCRIAFHLAFIEERFDLKVDDMDAIDRVFGALERSLIQEIDVAHARHVSADPGFLRSRCTATATTHPVFGALVRCLSNHTVGRTPYDDYLAPVGMALEDGLPGAHDHMTARSVPPMRIVSPGDSVRETQTHIVFPRCSTMTLALERCDRPAPRNDTHQQMQPSLASNIYPTAGTAAPANADDNTEDDELFATSVMACDKYHIDYVMAQLAMERIQHPGIPFVSDLLLERFPCLLEAGSGDGGAPHELLFNYSPMTAHVLADLERLYLRHTGAVDSSAAARAPDLTPSMLNLARDLESAARLLQADVAQRQPDARTNPAAQVPAMDMADLARARRKRPRSSSVLAPSVRPVPRAPTLSASAPVYQALHLVSDNIAIAAPDEDDDDVEAEERLSAQRFRGSHRNTVPYPPPAAPTVATDAMDVDAEEDGGDDDGDEGSYLDDEVEGIDGRAVEDGNGMLDDVDEEGEYDDDPEQEEELEEQDDEEDEDYDETAEQRPGGGYIEDEAEVDGDDDEEGEDAENSADERFIADNDAEDGEEEGSAEAMDVEEDD